MTLTHFAIIAVCAYLFGSLSFAIIVSKVTLGKDIRNYGSGNAGLTNAYRTMGAKKTLFVLLGDIAKGAAAVSVGWALGGPVGKLTAGIFVILGHMFPLYFGFKGGKGVLVAAGAILAVQPVLLPVLAVIFLVCLVPTGMVSLGSITMAAAYPVLTLVYSLMRGLPTRDVVVCTVGAAIMGGMVIWMHRSNIQRIRDGKEYRFGQKHKSN